MQMVEANPVKFYVAKYFFLVFALLQWMIAGTLFYVFGWSVMNIVAVSFLTVIGLMLVFMFVVISDKIKRVAVGSNKFVVLQDDTNLRFEWPEIKSLQLIPFLNLCKVKIKGRRGSFYFFAARQIRAMLNFKISENYQRK
jgi:hypothetical protein